MEEKKLVVGILAHVDAGKTTLAEAFLFLSGVLREAGRVDHQDAFLDHFALERKRGITIFSKQALFQWKGSQGNGIEVTLLDTPGHVDFSAEMERTLQVLDYAVLVISGSDGVQGHTMTLWGLLKKYGIPTFLFVNKMDQPGTDTEKILRELQEKLDENCVAFTEWDKKEANAHEGTKEKGDALEIGKDALWENLSLCSESLVEEYLESGEVYAESIGEAIVDRKLFPVYFGAALHAKGVEPLLEGLADYTLVPEYPEEFGARVFKISRDKQGNRLTHLKVTGGILKAKQMIGKSEGDGSQEEKVDQIRLYNGQAFQVLQEAPAGTICAVTGPVKTMVGEGLGAESENVLPSLEPVMTYELRLPEDCDAITALGQLRKLEEEEPLLHVIWKEQLQQIHVQTMGEVQVEILKTILLERFGLNVTFENGSIVYKETLAEPVLGVGHYEPLKHYAEVQLLLEPGERGSGLSFASYVSEDDLGRNWQRLILTHLEERTHPGVLLGAELTDLRISIVGGRAHIKHTEGGDFRQATYRAIRQGLRNGRSILLEPVFDFRLEIPVECLGRAMTDIQLRHGRFETPKMEGNQVTICGVAPVSTMQDYQREVISYSRGLGKISCTLKGYEPCHDAEEVLRKVPYDPDADLDNPTGSVFCSHGAGTVVPWNLVYESAHVPLREDFLEAARKWQKMDELERQGRDSRDLLEGKKQEAGDAPLLKGEARRENVSQSGMSGAERYISLEEIDAIFEQGRKNHNRKENDRQGFRRYHRSNRRVIESTPSAASGIAGNETGNTSVKVDFEKSDNERRNAKNSGSLRERCLLVDGYNVIYAWPKLRELLDVNIASARDRLIDDMSNYQGYIGGILILVFDAYKVKGNPGSVQKWNNIYVVYTKEAETADQYIEKTVHEIASKYQVTVATSDGLEQMIIWGEGAARMSSLGLLDDYEKQKELAREKYGIQ